MAPLLTLVDLQRIRLWHAEHRLEHPLEGQFWDAMLSLWLMGWVGWLPAFALELDWAWPLCLLASSAPELYVRWRRRAHQLCHLRCDWLDRICGR